MRESSREHTEISSGENVEKTDGRPEIVGNESYS